MNTGVSHGIALNKCQKFVKMLWPELLYYKNEVIWMDLEMIILSEISQRKTNII